MTVLSLLGVIVLALLILGIFVGIGFFFGDHDDPEIGVAIIASVLYLVAVCAWALDVPFPMF